MKKLTLWWSSDQHKLYSFVAVYIIITCISWLQTTELGEHVSNNFRIFKYSSWHLLDEKPLYQPYPQEYHDYFFYNPVFAFLFTPFNFLAENLSILIWQFMLVAAIFYALRKLPFKNQHLWWVLLLVIPEVKKNLGHVQPNILNCALMILAFVNFEKGNMRLGAFICSFLFCIKGFGAVVGIMCFFYPNVLKTIGYAIVSLLFLLLLPLSLTYHEYLFSQYIDWLHILNSDVIIESLSLVGFTTMTLGWESAEPFINLIGIGLLFWAWYFLYEFRQKLTIIERAQFLGFLLVWVVAFNRAAESPTYLYAVVGLTILFYLGKPSKFWKIILGICYWGITILPTDLTPRIIRELDYQYFFRPLFLLPIIFFAFQQCDVFTKYIKKYVASLKCQS